MKLYSLSYKVSAVCFSKCLNRKKETPNAPNILFNAFSLLYAMYSKFVSIYETGICETHGVDSTLNKNFTISLFMAE